MKYFLVILLSCLSWSTLANESFYKLGVGDQIRIQVYDEPELSIETRVGD
ncbi:polysaccharide biosynthesis/export family protein, partial [Vibrio anguillarum]